MADVDKANPLNASTISSFPSNERDSRAAIETILDLEHDGDGTSATGRHKFGRGDGTARDAITLWETGSLWINTDTTPNTLQMNIGTQATPVWIDVDAGSVITTRGDIIRGSSSGDAERLAVGSSAEFLTSDGTDISWGALTAASDTVAGVIEIAVQSELEAASSNTLTVTPGRLGNHPGVVKGWVKFNLSGTVSASRNVASVTDNGTADWTVNWATDFSGSDYSVLASLLLSGSPFPRIVNAVAQAVGTTQLVSTDGTASFKETNVSAIFAQALGDQ